MTRLLCTLALLGACAGPASDTDPVVEDCPRLEQDVDRVDFASAIFGVDSTRPIFLDAPCDGAPLFLDNAAIDGDEVFEVTVSTIEIEPGGNALVEVTYVPPVGDYGPHAAALRMTHSAGELFVSLVGGVDPDQDGDGFLAVEVGGDDCDDFDADVGASTVEVDNGRDDDCDGFIDEDFVGAGDIMITELMLRPSAVRPDVGQWIEVRNASDRSVDLKNWTFRGTAGELTVEDSVPIRAGGLAVLAVAPDPEDNGGVVADGRLIGSGTPLTIRDWSLDLYIDEVQVAALEDAADWPDPLGASIGLDPYTLLESEARKPDDWCAGTSPLGEGGDLGTPGLENDWCPQIDHDGDGASAEQGDCDDADPTRERRLNELWDGKDNDCDDAADDMFADRAYMGWLEGDRSSQLGGSRELQSHDWSGDGFDDIVINQHAFAEDIVVLDGALLDGAEGTLATGLVIGTIRSGRRQGFPLRTPADVDDDGDDDLVLLLDEADGSHLLWAFDGAPTGGETWDQDDAELIVDEGVDSISFTTNHHAVGSHDLDGDGVVDVVYGEARSDDGIVFVLSLAGASGIVDLDDVQHREWTGSEDRGLGVWTEGGDMDGDGYAELFVSESDPRRMGGISLWRVPGGKSLPEDGNIALAADLEVQGITTNGLVFGGRPMAADVDDDGAMDLIVGDPGAKTLHVLLDHGADTGVHEVTSAADIAITSPLGDVGMAFDQLDYAGDGSPGLVVGASSYMVNGLVFGLSSSTLGSGVASLDPADADFTIRGVDGRDRFGQLVGGGDFDGDGVRNGLVVGAPYLTTSAGSFVGALYVFEPE